MLRVLVVPGFFVGGADEGFHAQRLGEVVDPAGRAAVLNDNEVNLFAFEDSGEV